MYADMRRSVPMTSCRPTTPWEAVWKGIAEWWGIPKESMPFVLPNAANFPEDTLYGRDALFQR